jgi:hypothetical protein
MEGEPIAPPLSRGPTLIGHSGRASPVTTPWRHVIRSKDAPPPDDTNNQKTGHHAATTAAAPMR